jgi:hypothetical protein
VTASFSANDALSGIDGVALIEHSIVTEGQNQSASATFADFAGNTVTVTASGIHIDKTVPVASAVASPPPNAGGWNNTDVTVTFSGADNLSGIENCSAPVVLTTEGQNQSASGTCTDVAGNVSASATVSGINIKKSGPSISGMPAANCTIWPPNGKMVQVAEIRASGGSLSVDVTSNEPVKPADIVVKGGVVTVRAERAGKGSARIYSIVARAIDYAGAKVEAKGSCTVPHDMGK